jgi:hypothetical protein
MQAEYNLLKRNSARIKLLCNEYHQEMVNHQE